MTTQSNSSSLENASRLRVWENLHIVFWLVKDMCWVSDFHVLGVTMIVPTLLVAVYMVYKSWGNRTELIHNTAVLCRIAANSSWMVGEFLYNNTTKPAAQALFVLGMVVLAFHYVPKFRLLFRGK